MSPTPSTASTAEALSAATNLVKRSRCYWSYGTYVCRSGWYYWGRWVLAGVALFFFLVFAFCLLCVARRRRKRGVKPVYGTGWMAPPAGKYGAPNQNSGYPMNNYNNNNNQTTGAAADYYTPGPPAGYNPPPAYGMQQPQYTGTTFNPNDGYYGVQQPQNAYQRDHTYPPAPPVPENK